MVSNTFIVPTDAH